MKRIVDNPWFFAFEFTCITIAVALWINLPGFSWQPLLIAIIPLFIRIAAGSPPLVRTPFNLPIAIFLIMAGIGVWTAYQPESAWIKFWLLLAAALYYFLIVRLPVRSLYGVSVILSVLGLVVSIFFLLSNNWLVELQKFQFITAIGIAWMKIRPDLGLESLIPNDIAGIAAMTLPFSIVLSIEFHMRKSVLRSVLAGIIAGFILIAILLTASRGAWLAIGITVGLWILWLLTDWIARKTNIAHKAIFIPIIGLMICLGVVYIGSTFHGSLTQIAIGDAGESTLDQRFHLFWSASELIKGVPFIGGSLEGFPGLYSSYILINPNFITGYSNNIFLDATLEQGIISGLLLCLIYMGSFLSLALRPVQVNQSLLRKAILSSLLIIIFHSLVDDIVYRTYYTPLLLVVPGMAAGLIISNYPVPRKIRATKSQVRRLALPVLISLLAILAGLTVFNQPLRSAWYTNLGAVEMAKVELANFPTGTWNEDQKSNLYTTAQALFNQALEYEPMNPRAHYRLGLIAMSKRNFGAAVTHLEIAHRGDPYHRGMLKALGLAYVWNGQVADAIPLLSLIPESNQELAIYPWWWREQNRPDLATFAEQYLALAVSRE